MNDNEKKLLAEIARLRSELDQTKRDFSGLANENLELRSKMDQAERMFQTASNDVATQAFRLDKLAQALRAYMEAVNTSQRQRARELAREALAEWEQDGVGPETRRHPEPRGDYHADSWGG
jgi:chromosome segregation ATPase